MQYFIDIKDEGETVRLELVFLLSAYLKVCRKVMSTIVFCRHMFNMHFFVWHAGIVPKRHDILKQ